MDGNVNQEVPINVEPPAQAAEPETPAPVEPKPAEEQPSVGPDDTELAQQREAIKTLRQAGLISEEPQVPPPEIPAVETIKPRQSIIARFLTWLMNLFRRR